MVDSPGMDEQQLYDIAYYELRNKLQSIQGVISPAVFGGKLRRIYAYMDPARLEAYGLTLMDVQNALAKYNVLIPAGNRKIGEGLAKPPFPYHFRSGHQDPGVINTGP